MSRLHRLRRRAGHSVLTHERARALAADRLGGLLEPTQATWLDEHLATCPPCRAVAAGYQADRVALRALRDRPPEPPRDLWAGVAVAIERGSRRDGRPARGAADGRWSSIPVFGLVSGVAVMVTVLGATLLTGGFMRQPIVANAPVTPPPLAVASRVASPGPTPIVVGAGSVGWVGTAPDGALAYNVTNVREVCPADRQPDCAPVADRDSKPVVIAIRPKSISQSPVRNQAVVVGTDATGGDAMVVIVLPTAEPSPTPASTPTVATPSPTPIVTATPTSSGPPASQPPSVEPTRAPSSSPTPTPSVQPTASATPVLAPSPSLVVALAIVSHVTVVGESAAYSPDGAWFAFSARPSDGSAGPDIYVWRVGDPLARPLTTDHASVFASWAGGALLGSRLAPAASASGQIAPRSFIIDPVGGAETPISETAWRPIVDPTSAWAVTWDGTLKLASDGLTAVPAAGALNLHRFTPGIGLTPGPASATLVADGGFAEFDVRWDETGTWLAVWLADPSDRAIGRLSLLHLDPATGTLEHPAGAPRDVTALPGFSIANGRLAWATPPGQGGEGSRVQIVAWTAHTVGGVESGPVEGVVVVH